MMSTIPIDLMIEIFLRLPAKSIARFRCVSKLWGSILCRPGFTELFLTRSSAHPRLLFAVNSDWADYHLFSSPQPQNPYGKQSSLLVTADFRMKFNKYLFSTTCQYASGLIYCLHERTKIRDTWNSHEERDFLNAICNPSTGQYAVLPELRNDRCSYSFLGFDPIDKQIKVLSMVAYRPYGHKVLTLAPGELRWRKIHCPLTHEPLCEGICINGVLYYLGWRTDDDDDDDERSYAIVCFDVRSENFKFIDDAEITSCNDSTKLINYKGKLGMIFSKYDVTDAIEVCLWVLDDVEKGKWSKSVYALRDDKFSGMSKDDVSVAVTATGEIVLWEDYNYRYKPFYVFYFNPEGNTLQRVEIQGFGEFYYWDRRSVEVFVDHVDDLNLSDAKIFKSSQGLDIIWERPIPQHREEVRD